MYLKLEHIEWNNQMFIIEVLNPNFLGIQKYVKLVFCYIMLRGKDEIE